MRTNLRFAVAALIAVGACAPILAHHSFAAEYDNKAPMKVTGAVTKIDWSNPHVYFYVDVEDESGKVTNWAMEMGAPGALRGRGWTRTTLTIGDVITVEASPAKDGSKHANARNVTLATTGEKLGAASSEGKQ
jgi:hypothetical protein